MNFAIAPLEYFNSLGFDTSNWRKSLDGTQAMCHAEFALTLADEDKLDIYDIQDEAFQELINGPEWTERQEIEE